MSRIEQLIEELCPEGVEYKELGEIVNILDYLRKPISKDKREKGAYPYYGANGILEYVKDYIFEGTFLLFGEDGSVINKDGSPVLNWATGKIWVNNHAHVLSEIEDIALLRYVYFYLNTIDVSSIVRGVPPKINQQSLRAISIPIPPLPIQQEIVTILDTFTALDASLQAELEARRKQYEFYRNQLLNFEGKEVEWKTLGEVCEIFDGTHQTPKYTNEGIRFVSVENIKALYETKKYISKIDYENLYKIKPQLNDVFMTRIGSIGACAIVDRDEELAFYVTLTLLRPNQNIVKSKFVKFFIESSIGQIELRKRTLVNAVPIKINLGEIGKTKIPIPPLSEQERIVGILDKFDALVSSTGSATGGLPAEIDARRKQYEYYREKLLTFEPK